MRYAVTLMSDAADDRLTHLSFVANRLTDAMARPTILAWGCVIALAGLGWLALGLMSANGILDALCRPGATRADFGVLAAMWAAMTLAMMLPSAAPMIHTYAEIGETAARKGERIVSPLVLAGGYAVVWLAFAAVAAGIQGTLSTVAPPELTQSRPFAGALFVAAGLYQFTTLKHACLSQCQRPFPFFFTHWQTSARGVFRLGVKQGIYCLGCCWAMMLLMFAAGTMNVLWMAALGVVMTIEKMTTTAKFAHVLGGVLLAAGLVSIASGVLR